MKLLRSMMAMFMAGLLLASCGAERIVIDNDSIDFSTSAFKHINNGGLSHDSLPYNIDAITGATLTVEGPGVVASIPLSIRELESKNEFAFRGIYKDSSGEFVYEGIDLYHLIQDMTDGDNGIFLTEKAHHVQLKDSNRTTVAQLDIRDIIDAHEKGRPILIAYGIGTIDGKTNAPFVFDADGENSRSLGYIDQLDNDDGCLRLVYDLESYDCGQEYKTFSNVAYIYICEESAPGFKHTASDGVYFKPEYTNYIVTFRGSAIGNEIDLTVEQLENLVQLDDSGSLVPGGIGYSDEYSLANNAYWYVNQYEGLDLYKLLCYLGMDTAEEIGRKRSRTTLVTFNAADGKPSPESFSVEALSNPDAFGFYNKNAADSDDGTYVSTNADLVRTGYPVLLAYGVNQYPYTIHTANEGYLPGLSNNGGPMRVVFGKTQYNHANGSHQVQLVSEIIAGEDRLYNTHKYTDNPALKALETDLLTVVVRHAEDSAITQTTFSVGQIEDIIYGPTVAKNEKAAAKAKYVYEYADGGSAIFEGVNLKYFLMNVVEIPGTVGSVTFFNSTQAVTIPLEDLFADGYNKRSGLSGLPAILAFSKNGAPLVSGTSEAGYLKSIPLTPFSPADPANYHVDNCGGPLMLVVPSAAGGEDGYTLENVTGMTVNIEPDSYAHLSEDMAAVRGQSVRFYGEGLEQETIYTVEQLEKRQRQAKTLDYSVLGKDGVLEEQRYRGIPIFDLFADIGIRSNAGDVTVYAQDGSSIRVPLSRLKKQTYTNYVTPGKNPLCAMLTYGSGAIDRKITEGTPLTAESGGPLKLMVPMAQAHEANAAMCVKNVAAVEVSANEVTSWSHNMSDVYNEFLDYEMTLTVRNDAHEWSHTFTVEQLESLESLVAREKYSVLELGTCEGIDLWKFVKLIAGGVEGIDTPISVTTYAEDGYKNDLLSSVYMDGLNLGVLNDNGERVPVIIAYAFNGTPLVNEATHAGYTGLSGNTAGPLRTVVEGVQGASLKYFNKLVVTVPGSGEIDIQIDNSLFQGK